MEGRRSAGISDLYGVEILGKGKSFSQEILNGIDYQNVNSSKWTSDKNTNALVKELINN